MHLANQNQVQCIRREKGNCRICYATSAATDFQISSKSTISYHHKQVYIRLTLFSHINNTNLIFFTNRPLIASSAYPICIDTILDYWHWQTLSSGMTTMKFLTKACCGYGAAGVITKSRDCVMIPGLSMDTNSQKFLPRSQICGAGGLASKSTAVDATTKLKTLCCKLFSQCLNPD